MTFLPILGTQLMSLALFEVLDRSLLGIRVFVMGLFQ